MLQSDPRITPYVKGGHRVRDRGRRNCQEFITTLYNDQRPTSKQMLPYGFTHVIAGHAHHRHLVLYLRAPLLSVLSHSPLLHLPPQSLESMPALVRITWLGLGLGLKLRLG